MVDLQARRGQREHPRNGKILYWNALEGTERHRAHARHRLRQRGPQRPDPRARLSAHAVPVERAGRRPTPGPTPAATATRSFPGGNGETNNDGALSARTTPSCPTGACSPPAAPPTTRTRRSRDTGIGVVELEGLRNTRIYDPATNRWSQTGSMNVGPLVPEPRDPGQRQRVRGQRRGEALKPVYPGRAASTRGTNVRKTETYDAARGTLDATTARRPSARCRCSRACTCCPNGHVFYNAAGQAFNPFGQAYDEALWNIAASYDPDAERWKDLGIPGAEGGALGGVARTCDFGTAAVRPGQARDPRRRQEPHAARLPRLHVLADAAAAARCGRPLHEGVVPHRRRRAEPAAARAATSRPATRA